MNSTLVAAAFYRQNSPFLYVVKNGFAKLIYLLIFRPEPKTYSKE
jgi:hypothetical protein